MDITKEPRFSLTLCGFGVLLLLSMAATWYIPEQKTWSRGVIGAPKVQAGLTIVVNHNGPLMTPLEKIEKAQRSWRDKGGEGDQVHLCYPDGTYEEITFEELKSLVKP